MKKGFFVGFSLVCILSNITLNSMTTQRARQISSKTVQPQQKIYQTKATQKSPIFFDRVKQYYNQAKQRISQYLYGTNYPQTVQNETTALLHDIHQNPNSVDKKLKILQSFDTFLIQKNQDYVDQLLDKLAFSNHEINFLNAAVLSLILKTSFDIKVSKKIVSKITTWAEKNIINIFNQDFPINDDFFLILLLYINGTLIPTIHDNLDAIKKQPTGQQFLSLLQSEHPALYDAILQRKQPIKGILKESMQKSLEELRTRE